MSNWKSSWWTILWIFSFWFRGNVACLSREQFLAAVDPKTTLVFEAKLLQSERTNQKTDAYVHVTRILSQPETGWHLQPGNVAHLTGILPRPVDPVNCLPAQTVGDSYLWIARNSLETMRSLEDSLVLVPGGLFSIVDDSDEVDERKTMDDNNALFAQNEPPTRQASLAKAFEAERLQISDDNNPCASVSCQFGAVCERWPSPSTGQTVGVCVCPQPEVLHRRRLCNLQSGQVCAQNGRMYTDECALVLASCVQQTNLKRIELPAADSATARALCGQLAEDRLSLQSDRLEKGDTFQLSSAPSRTDNTKHLHESRFDDTPQHDAANPADQRRSSSSNQLKPVDSSCDTQPCTNDLKPVCGTDGVTYQNECLLRQRSCVAVNSGKPAIRINYASHCINRKTSESLKSQPDVRLCAGGNLCLYGGLCPVQRADQFYSASTNSIQTWFDRCACEHISCLGYRPDPLCANDGQTYSNECFLRRQICETQTARKILYRGTCASNPCLGHTCRWAGERCQVDELGQPKCVCPDPCPNVVLPVCGSDGVTYDSHCHLERTACTKMKDIFILYAGQCSEEPHCEALGLRCQGYEVCSRIQGTHVYDAKPQYVYKKSWSNSAHGLQPQSDQIVARCLCPICPEKGIGDQVCGTDGQTYRSECHLRASACQRQLHQLKVKARGPCDACKTKDCPHHAICRLNAQNEPECICPTDCLYVRKPVCGTDGKMYENECFLKVAACAEQRDIFVAQEGPCATCPFGCPLGYQCLKGECVCRDACPKPISMEAEVCGSDGQLYPSECELKRQACLRQTNVQVDPSGAKCRDLAKMIPLNNNNDSKYAIGYYSLPQSDDIGLPTCSCNKIGALSEFCDHRGRCHCKWGVRGDHCDQCMPDYWGIQNGHECIACSCHPDGALNTTCDPMTGQCNCRPGIYGRQCSICPDAGRLTKSGCIKQEPERAQESDGVEPEQTNQSDEQTANANGRKFSSDTTLLVRAPFSLRDPFMVELTFQTMKPNGALLHYRMAPSKQEQMLMENPVDQQFFLAIVNGQLELSYVIDGLAGRTLTVRSKQRLETGVQHTLRAGVIKGQPWIKLDGDPQTTVRDIEEKLNDFTLSDSLSAGGYGTIVVGRQVSLSGSTNTRLSEKASIGFTGCLLRIILHSGSPPQVQEIDLISGHKTELAWIGVGLLPSGLAEAPLCRVERSHTGQPAEKQRVQSDGTQSARQLVNPCEQTSCLNGASCESALSGEFKCICQPGWQGDRCDQIATIVPQFHGNSFIRLPGPAGSQAMERKRLRMELVFLLTDIEGVVFMVPPPHSPPNQWQQVHRNFGPFIGAYVDKEGYLFVVCRAGRSNGDSFPALTNMGDGLVELRYSTPVQPKQWHTLTIEKRTRMMIVQVDNGPKERVKTVPDNFRTLPRKVRQQLTAFNLSDSPVYIGGFSSLDPSIPKMKVRKGMRGALQKININEAEVVLAGPITTVAPSSPTDDARSIELWINVSQWQGPPCGPNHNPCQPDRIDSICRPQVSTATCACSTPLQLWQILREKADKNVIDAERQACRQRQTELNNAQAQMHLDPPVQEEKMSEQIQYDGIPNLKMDSNFDKSVDTSGLFTRCGRLPISFKGKTSFVFRGLIEDMEDYNLRLHISTKNADGLLLLISANSGGGLHSYYKHLNTNETEITLLELRRGYIEYSIYVPDQSFGISTNAVNHSLIRKVLSIRSNRTTNDGDCHTIHIARSPRRGTLIIDHHTIVEEIREPSRSYRPNNWLFLGGTFVNISTFSNGLKNFTGCVGDLFVNEHPVQLLTTAKELRGPIEPCQ